MASRKLIKYFCNMPLSCLLKWKWCKWSLTWNIKRMGVVMPTNNTILLIHLHLFCCVNRSEFWDFYLITTKRCDTTFFVWIEYHLGDVCMYCRYITLNNVEKFNEYSPLLFLSTLFQVYLEIYAYYTGRIYTVILCKMIHLHVV